nr:MULTISPECIES: YwaF family protein [unclassified Butyricicoccus]
MFGYYVTHAILVVCGLSLATLGFYRPDPKDIPRILKTFGLLAVGAHLINLLLRLTLCPEANYFFTYGAEIGVLKLFWRIIPAPLLYGLPALLIFAGYMYAVCALSRLMQRAEEVPFS